MNLFKKIFGCLLIATPFIAVFAYSVYIGATTECIKAFVASAVVVAIIGAGVWLWYSDRL